MNGLPDPRFDSRVDPRIDARLDSRVMREAMVAQLLGDLDSLVKRVEAIVPPINQAVSGLKGSAKETTQALDHFRATTQAIVDQAQTSAVDHIIRRTNTVAQTSVQEQTEALSKAARSFFDREANALMKAILTELKARDSLLQRWLPPIIAALLTATVTVTGLHFMHG